MKTTRLSLTLAALAALGVGGCDPFDIDFTNSTEGEEGVLSFSYEGSEPFDCLFGCYVDHPIAAGAVAGVSISGADPNLELQAQTTSDVATIVEFTPSFSCSSNNEIRGVEPDEPCNAGETRDVSWFAWIQGNEAGAFDLEITSNGEIVDTLSMSVGDVVRADLYEVDRMVGEVRTSTNETKVFRVRFKDALNGDLEAWSGATWSVGDNSGVARRGDPLENLFGGPNDLVLEGLEPGTTTVVLDLGSYSESWPVTVTGQPNGQ
ncbi:MAG: hypothetical protein U0271_36695 [Polyangiaceae bacterium]